MNRFLLDVWHDLKQKRLWPVAALLGAALLLVPVFLLKGSTPADEAIAPPEAAVAPGAPAPGAGASAPSSMASLPISLESTPRLASSPLDALKSKDPFERPNAARISAAVGEIASGTAAVADETFGTDLSSGLSSSSSGGSSLPSSLPGGGGSSGGGSTGGGSAGGSSTPSPKPGSGSASPGRGKVQLYDYRVDLRVGESAGRKVLHRDIARLTPLPSAERPLLVFLGVTDDGSKAVFLVDTASARTSGGQCEPDPTRCTFLSVSKESGKNVVRLLDAEGRAYDVEVTDIKLQRVERGQSGAEEPGSDDASAPGYVPPPAPAPPPPETAEEEDKSKDDEKSGDDKESSGKDEDSDGSKDGDVKQLRHGAAVRQRRVGFLFSELFDLVRAGR